MKRTNFLFGLLLLLTSCIPGTSPDTTQEVSTIVPSPTLIMPEISTPTSLPILTPTESDNDDSTQCLSPVRNFDIPIEDIATEFTMENVLPPQEWQKIVYVPNASNLELIQTIGTETIIWVGLSTGGFVRYQVTDQQWNNGTLVYGPDTGYHSCFLDMENTVWKSRYGTVGKWDKNPESILSRFNEQSNQWESVILDLVNQDNLGIRHEEVDSQGKIWFLIEDENRINHLYSLDPNTLITEQHLTDYILMESFVIAENILYISAITDDRNLNIGRGDTLITYMIDQNEIKTYIIPSVFYNGEYSYYDPIKFYRNNLLFVDSQERVWLGTIGWVNLSSEDNYKWHYIIPNPIFIDVMPGSGKWMWDPPVITHETQDGLLWYNALRGTGWVDPGTGKWCVFTSYSSNVLADHDGNLWILVDDWLYMRKQ